MEAVERLCDDALADPDLFDRPVRGDNEFYTPIEGGYSLTVRIPGAEQEQVRVALHELDLDIRIRNYVRSIPLPGVLRGAEMTDHQIRDGALVVSFRMRENRETEK